MSGHLAGKKKGALGRLYEEAYRLGAAKGKAKARILRRTMMAAMALAANF